MRRAFTLVEMLISLLLTAMVFTYLYATLDGVRDSHARYAASVKSVVSSQRIYETLTLDLSEVRGDIEIVHEAGYDRIDFFTDHSLYDIPRPWVHYYISRKEQALIRIESTLPIDFFRTDYIGDANGTYFYADRLATGCSSLRFTQAGPRVHLMLRCAGIEPIVATLYKGDR